MFEFVREYNIQSAYMYWDLRNNERQKRILCGSFKNSETNMASVKNEVNNGN